MKKHTLYINRNNPIKYTLIYLNLFILNIISNFMEPVKEAFHKVKQDMNTLKEELDSLKNELSGTREQLIEMCEILKTIVKNQTPQLPQPNQVNNTQLLKKNRLENSLDSSSPIYISQERVYSPSQRQAQHTDFIPNQLENQLEKSAIYPPNHHQNYHIPQDSLNPTLQHIIPTHNQQSLTTPTHNFPYSPYKAQNSILSTGNGGVPTDRQTDRQTDQQTNKSSYNLGNIPLNEKRYLNNNFSNPQDSIQNATLILDSLDTLKKEIRLKFKRLTEQEFLVFSIIYQFSETKGSTTYNDISLKIGLTESSIRDYVGRLIKKGIPVEKTKINNKSIALSISPNLKKIASLETIFQLRAL